MLKLKERLIYALAGTALACGSPQIQDTRDDVSQSARGVASAQPPPPETKDFKHFTLEPIRYWVGPARENLELMNREDLEMGFDYGNHLVYLRDGECPDYERKGGTFKNGFILRIKPTVHSADDNCKENYDQDRGNCESLFELISDPKKFPELFFARVLWEKDPRYYFTEDSAKRLQEIDDLIDSWVRFEGYRRYSVPVRECFTYNLASDTGKCTPDNGETCLGAALGELDLCLHNASPTATPLPDCTFETALYRSECRAFAPYSILFIGCHELAEQAGRRCKTGL